MLGNVPENTDRFVGRAAEQGELVSSLTAGRLTTLTGIGGVGKTRLAAHALRALPERQRTALGRTCWADLGALPDERLLIGAVADAVGFADHTPDGPFDALCAWLADQRLLLVLDSCEHLVTACRNLVADLLTACPRLTVLATSRQRLGVAGEAVVPVRPLACDGDGLALFLDRAVAVAPALRMRHPEQDRHAAEICRLLDGVPLALELASAQLMHHPIGELVDRLRSHQAGLTAPAPVWPRRHRSLRTAIGWSHELCGPLERLLWTRLSVFPGVFDSGAARGVCAGGPLSPDAVTSLLAELTAKSVVAQEADGRYRLHAPVREYGHMWLDELEARDEVADRHADHFLELARSADAGWLGPQQASWYRRIDLAHADLCAALEHLIGTRPEHAVELAGLVGFFWSCCGHLREARRYLERVLPLARHHGAAREKAQWALGVAALLQGEHAKAAAIGRRCARDAAHTGSVEGRLSAAYLLGITHLMNGEPRRAYDDVGRALHRVAEPALTSPSVLRCHLVRVFALTGLGRLEEAAREAASLRAGCAAQGEWWARSYTDYQLALISLAQGQPGQAAEHARAMLEGKRMLSDSFGIALGMDLLAAAAAADGQGEAAALVSGIGQMYWLSVGHSQRGMPELRDVRETCWRSARAAVGDGAFDRAFRRGTEADPGSVLDLAVAGQLLSGA
ncbi:NB-ARC domain-containing protein [Streptomyces sp. NPDC047123]|uniref:ATP-binding protein n=1 Tax=Streptomyces sp. NPDC047123 TaxID=3155622 RepID=UPI0033F6AB87